MSDEELEAKAAYFKEQDLIEISDDETDFPDDGYLNIERALADIKAMPPPRHTRQRKGSAKGTVPPRLTRQTRSFNGSTAKQRIAGFEAQSAKQQANLRPNYQRVSRSAITPENDVASTFRSARPTRKGSASSPVTPRSRKKLKHSTSPDTASEARTEREVPFYMRMGIMPRELKNGKDVKQADIKVEPEHKQLLRGKIVYFYPNNDLSLARRRRIHKIIQLGAAWVTQWKDDVTHVMVDDGDYTFSQLLKHLDKADLPRNVVLVKFDPYVPQCIQFNTLLDPSLGRFSLKDAPKPGPLTKAPELPYSPTSLVSLQMKPSRRQLATKSSQKTNAEPSKEGFAPLLVATKNTSSPLEVVEDSFVMPSPDAAEEPAGRHSPYNDDFLQAVKETRAISHLPLDEEDSGTLDNLTVNTIAQDSDCETDDEYPKPSPKRRNKISSNSLVSKSATPKRLNKSVFKCIDPGTKSSSLNPNTRTIQILGEMCKYHNQMGDQWRTFAYRRGIATLRKQTHKITTAAQAGLLPFIGTRLAEKIEEIALTDHLRQLDTTRNDPTAKTLRRFLGIYGVGLTQANKWVQAGHRTLEDLLEKEKLTEGQKVGIAHYADFAARIPRAEVEAHGTFVRDVLKRIDGAYQVTIMGSYRRGARDSGDIDLIISKPGTSLSTMRKVVFHKLVAQLFAQGFLKVTLATSHRSNDGSKWLGASRLPGSMIWRRLDLLLAPEEEMGAALIYFTGDEVFNRSMRLLANKKGMRLNQSGLYKDVMRRKGRETLNKGMLLESRDEKRIFEILGVPWREPSERVCSV
ncbi:hypothetical protein CC78DRAFT_512868 [Lojkania enalia]|uniref:DNA-directed DNA polymerase n=1 Tax=Lojkania enalia TaxID=147567 RepID=A0A9P4KHV0_9PLEO|nr:hypothetical protein CC78DRAFT_512868 [Didymosphaeria enalia]